MAGLYADTVEPIAPGGQRRVTFVLRDTRGQGVLGPDETISQVDAVTEPSNHGDLTTSNAAATSQDETIEGETIKSGQAVKADVALASNAATGVIYQVMFELTSSSGQKIFRGIRLESIDPAS
jgi:Flp pilus assembly protein TadG